MTPNQSKTLARMDDHKYVEITRPAWEAIYHAICRELPGHLGVTCPVLWGVAGAYGQYTETWWGTRDAPILWIRQHKENREDIQHFVIQELVYEDA